MTDHLTATTYLVAAEFDVPAPAEVTAAQELLEDMRKRRDVIAAETAPDLGTITKRNLTKIHDALVMHEMRDVRLRAADAMLTALEQQAQAARFNQHAQLEEPLAEKFNDAAARFTTAHAALEGDIDQVHALSRPDRSDAWRKLTESAYELDRLATARDDFANIAGPVDVGNDKLERFSRYAVVPDLATVTRAGRRHGIEGWADLISRGFTLRWQTRDAQQANAALVREHARAVHA